jgi:DtxR family Mn-dependent transcriptional regulator
LADYLRAVYVLSSPVADCGAVVHDAPALAAHVSRLLGVSRPTSGEMLKRLEQGGLVERGTRREVLLTAAGRRAAEEAIRRLRILECFVVDFLGTSLADAAAEASVLEAGMDEEMVERLYERLGQPERCPHGWPVDPQRDRDPAPSLASLAALAPGSRGRVARIAEQDSSLLASLVAAGLVPGATVEVLAVPRQGEPVIARVARRRRELSRAEAEAVLIDRPRPS